MKKLTYIAACACIWGFSSCADMFLDLEPLDTKTDVVYFQTPEHFREYATGLYGQLLTRVRDKDCVKNRVKRAKIVRFTLC